jgi:hypothetical protein
MGQRGQHGEFNAGRFDWQRQRSTFHEVVHCARATVACDLSVELKGDPRDLGVGERARLVVIGCKVVCRGPLPSLENRNGPILSRKRYPDDSDYQA